MSSHIRKISKDEIVLIHDRIIEATGGSPGIREINLLESITNKPFGHYFGKELYPGVFLKAAVIFESLVKYHVFVDGNKRSAIAIMEYFLYKCGYKLDANKDQKEQFTLDTAQTPKPDLTEIANWIKQHAKKSK